jgi:N-acetylglucosaminyldiphosphoundecaprenol N-acetyl-beta-D-mannosaminyltransferase
MLTNTDQPTDQPTASVPVVIPECPEQAPIHNGPSGLDNLNSVDIWGIPLASVDYGRTLDLVDELIERREPSFFITANLHYAMLSGGDARLREVNDRAAFIVADGMPMVWYSRLIGRPLPERVAGADLIFMLSHRAAKRGHSLFLLGGGPGIAEQAAQTLTAANPGLKIVGIESPMLDRMTEQEHEQLIWRIRTARPDLLFVAFGQPKGELWLAQTYQSLGVPACVQLGASFDFAAGRIRRAPRWTQRLGAEWLYRISRQPKRMIPRYAADALFLAKSVARDAAGACESAGSPCSG